MEHNRKGRQRVIRSSPFYLWWTAEGGWSDLGHEDEIYSTQPDIEKTETGYEIRDAECQIVLMLSEACCRFQSPFHRGSRIIIFLACLRSWSWSYMDSIV